MWAFNVVRSGGIDGGGQFGRGRLNGTVQWEERGLAIAMSATAGGQLTWINCRNIPESHLTFGRVLHKM
jgi:hypothetical protein